MHHLSPTELDQTRILYTMESLIYIAALKQKPYVGLCLQTCYRNIMDLEHQSDLQDNERHGEIQKIYLHVVTALMPML